MAQAAANVAYSFLRSQLVERRDRLEASKSALPAQEVLRLLHEVDRALDRMRSETYGICEVCETPIEDDRLLANPLACTCLDHMSEPERRELERDLELAVRVQTGLLPQCEVRVGDWESCYHYEPLGAVSGDFCDLAAIGGRLFFLVGDVMGKGVSASLLMSHLHAIFRSLVRTGLSVTELTERANRLFCEATRPPHYATLVCGFASGNGEVELVNAGHCPPVVARTSAADLLPSTGLPIGLFPDAAYTSSRITLSCGDALVLYTDGVSEAHDGAGEEYGPERIAGNLRLTPQDVAGSIVAGCMESLTKFRNGTAKADDMTLAVVRRHSALIA